MYDIIIWTVYFIYREVWKESESPPLEVDNYYEDERELLVNVCNVFIHNWVMSSVAEAVMGMDPGPRCPRSNVIRMLPSQPISAARHTRRPPFCAPYTHKIQSLKTAVRPVADCDSIVCADRTSEPRNDWAFVSCPDFVSSLLRVKRKDASLDISTGRRQNSKG